MSARFNFPNLETLKAENDMDEGELLELAAELEKRALNIRQAVFGGDASAQGNPLN